MQTADQIRPRSVGAGGSSESREQSRWLSMRAPGESDPATLKAPRVYSAPVRRLSFAAFLCCLMGAICFGATKAGAQPTPGYVTLSGGTIFGPEPSDPTIALRGSPKIFKGAPLGPPGAVWRTVELWFGPLGARECDMTLLPASQANVSGGQIQQGLRVTVAKGAPGQSLTFQLRAYDAVNASSWAQASDPNAQILHGSSALFTAPLGSFNTPTALAGAWQSFNVHTDNPGTIVTPDLLVTSSIDDSTSGFIARVHQLPIHRFPFDENSRVNGERQLAEDYRDPETLAPFPNVADLGAAIAGFAEGRNFFLRPTVNWGLVDGPGENFAGNQPLPGVPAGVVVAENLATEIRGIVFLAQGKHRWGVNSDDGFRLSLGHGKGDVFGLVLGEFDGPRGASDTIFDFYVQQAGFYMMRCDWWQGSGGAEVEIFSVDDCGERALLNDRSNAGAVRVYPVGVGPAFCRGVAPANGATEVDVRSPVVITLVDDGPAPAGVVDPAGISLLYFDINQAQHPLSFKQSKSGLITTLIADAPPGGWTPNSPVFVQLTFNKQVFGFAFTATALPTGSFFIEAEDFNFNAGRTNPKAGVPGLDVNVMPYYGGAYDGLSAKANIDYFYPTAEPSGDVYRLAESPNVPMIANQAGNMNYRGAYFTSNSFRLGWVGQGEFLNFTRTLPAAKYRVYAALSNGNLGDGQNSGALLRVTSSPAAAPQTTSLLGVFNAPGNGAFGANVLVPLVDAAANQPVFVNGDNVPLTFRYAATLGDFDYLVFVPEGNHVPSLSDIPNQFTDEDKPTAAIPITVSDLDANDTLTLSATSLNGSLNGPLNFAFSGNGNSRSLVITPPLNASGTALITVWVSDKTGARQPRQFQLTVKPVNDPPTLGKIPDQSTTEDTPSPDTFFQATDLETASPQLKLSAKAADPTLIPDNQFVFTFFDGSWMTHFVPAPDRFGTTVVTVTVSDGSATATGTFLARVIAVNDPPSITKLTDQSMEEGATLVIPFTIGDKETAAAALSLFAGSGNPNLIPLSNLSFGGGGSNRTLIVKAPDPGTGFSALTVVVSDGASSNATTFTVTVTPRPRFDWGDAPDSYKTTKAANGPSHTIIDGFYLGSRVDSEPDGQPDALAQGDDKNPTLDLDDEDGVTFNNVMIAGLKTGITVTGAPFIAGAAGPFQIGFLDAWMDFNGDGDFEDADEHMLNHIPFFGGTTNMSFTIPQNAKPGKTFARFRLTRKGIDVPFGPAPDGEVEDYVVEIFPLLTDWGDAPEVGTSYETTQKRNGAVHVYVTTSAFQGPAVSLTHVAAVPPRLFLGRNIDSEDDGQPSIDAQGDDRSPSGAPDDEDGVRFLTPLIPGQTALVEIVSSSRGMIDAWIDYNHDGSWHEAIDRVWPESMSVTGGVNRIQFNVPANASPGKTFARFRLSISGGLSFTGPAAFGEVEDYQLTIDRPTRCDYSCSGRAFILAFPGNYTPDPANPSKLSLCIASQPETLCIVVIPSLRFTNVINFAGSRLINVDLPTQAELANLNDGITNKGIFIVANSDISVVGINSATNTTDGFRALPIDVLGTEYLVQGYRNVNAGKPRLNGSQFAIVGTESNTVVTITPSVRVGVRDPGVPFNITLQPGETYQLRNTNDVPGDLSGTEIRSSAPVGVFGGHRCANISGPTTFFCDHLVEQLMPVRDFATVFPVYRLQGRLGGDTYRVMASVDATQVFIDGVFAATLNRGQNLEKVIANGALITADKPVSVTQYANSSDFDGVDSSDPFMANVLPPIMYSTSHSICTGPARFESHWVNIIVSLDGRSSVSIDGTTIPAGEFQQIGSSAFYGVSKPLTFGLHSISSKFPAGVTVYGWGPFDSYGWPGCINFGDITPPVVIPPPDVTVRVGDASFGNGTVGGVGPAGCFIVLADLRPFLQVADACTVSGKLITVRQDPPPGTHLEPGDHTITFTATDPRGNTATTTMTITVLPDSGPPSIFCPTKPIVVLCEESTGAVVKYDVFARTLCGTNRPVICNPPSGSHFPVGRTLVTCHLDDPANPISCEFIVEVQCGQTHTVSYAVLENGQLQLTWTAAVKGSLQSAPTVVGPWKAVPNATSPFVVKPTGFMQYFRFLPATP
ncbi:MAG: HYR domain-containing protein [Verrucomicrobia bacterium]|nr:HYR domain-containing protein [Verrucomicrobiota bacterium]